MRHTPGPWFVANKNEIHSRKATFDEQGTRYGETPNLIARVYETGQKWEGISLDANARLIAAAPDLLEACKLLAEYVSWQWEDDWENRPNHLKIAETAIAKATRED